MNAPITHVTVHPDGAYVTRSGRASARDGVLAVRGLPLLLDEGQVTARVQGANLRGLRMSLDVEGRERVDESEAEAAFAASELECQRLGTQLKALKEQRDRLTQLVPAGPGAARDDAPAPTPERLRLWSGLEEAIAPWADELDKAIAELEREQRDAHEVNKVTRDALERISTAQFWGRWQPTRVAWLDLDGDRTEGEFDFSLSYRVDGALWTPAYSLQLQSDGREARLLMRALLAQATGEDWPASATLLLSTASSKKPIDLPELPALRLGVATPSSPAAWRPLPVDLDALFPEELKKVRTRGGAGPKVMRAPALAHADAEELGDTPRGHARTLDEQEETEAPVAVAGMALEEPEAPTPPPPQPPVAAAPAAGVAVSMLAGGGDDAPLFGMARKARMRAEPAARRPAAPPRLVQRDDLDYSRLRVAPFDAPAGVRGRLRPVSLEDEARELQLPSAGVQRARSVLEESRSRAAKLPRKLPAQHVLPAPIEGISYRYPCQGKAEVESDGRFHSVAVESRSLQVSMHYRTVARHDARAYRSVVVESGQGSPLLPGPTDVLVDGSLLRTVAFAGGALGEQLRFDVGVELGLKVVRNVRYDEQSKGLLGGSRLLQTAIEVEIASSLGREVLVEVLERVPVAADDEVKVSVEHAEPEAEKYEGEPRGAILEGGRIQRLTVPAGGKAKAILSYALKLDANQELAGGDRRG